MWLRKWNNLQDDFTLTMILDLCVIRDELYLLGTVAYL